MHIDEIIGAVKLQGNWSFYSGTIAEWIMDYQKYDPNFSISEYPNVFRNNILQVNENNAAEFRQAMHAYELSPEDLKTINEDPGKASPVQILIDFDKRLCVSSFYDIELEKYVPENWTGMYSNPLDHVPLETKKEYGFI